MARLRFRSGWTLLRDAGFVAVALALAACSPERFFGEGAGAPPPHLQVAEAERGLIRDVVPAVGRIRPARQVEVGAEVSGRVVAVEVDFDERVSAGQTLARLDPAPFEAALARAEAGLVAARAAEREAEAGLGAARLALSRARDLAGREAGPAAQAEDLAFEVARREAALAAARARVALSRSDVADARIDLDRTVIASPIDGFVLDRRVEPGQAVNAALSTPVLFVVAADLSRVVIEAEVAEADVARIAAGMETRFTVDAYPGEVFYGAAAPVRRSPQIRNRFVTYPVEVEARDPEQRLLPGMTAAVEFIAEEAVDVLVVPRGARSVGPPRDFVPPPEIEARLREEYDIPPGEPLLPRYRGHVSGLLLGSAVARGNTIIYVWSDGRIEARQVRIGAEDADRVEILEGLEAGELVITGVREPLLDR